MIESYLTPMYLPPNSNPQKAQQRQTRPTQSSSNKKSSSESRDKREFVVRLSESEKREAGRQWRDNSQLSMLFELIKQSDVYELSEWIESEPASAFMRSKDGRGPMWWAHEFGNAKIVSLLKSIGVPDDELDSRGLSPLDISTVKKRKRRQS